jgi:hypothetical protein
VSLWFRVATHGDCGTAHRRIDCPTLRKTKKVKLVPRPDRFRAYQRCAVCAYDEHAWKRRTVRVGLGDPDVVWGARF